MREFTLKGKRVHYAAGTPDGPAAARGYRAVATRRNLQSDPVRLIATGLRRVLLLVADGLLKIGKQTRTAA